MVTLKWLIVNVGCMLPELKRKEETVSLWRVYQGFLLWAGYVSRGKGRGVRCLAVDFGRKINGWLRQCHRNLYPDLHKPQSKAEAPAPLPRLASHLPTRYDPEGFCILSLSWKA